MVTAFSVDEHVIINGKHYHKLWLRDNCLCAKCRHAEGYDRFYDDTQRAVPIIKSAQILGEILSIECDESPVHHSEFSLE